MAIFSETSATSKIAMRVVAQSFNAGTTATAKAGLEHGMIFLLPFVPLKRTPLSSDHLGPRLAPTTHSLIHAADTCTMYQKIHLPSASTAVIRSPVLHLDEA